MRSAALKLLALLPIPVILGLVIWAGQRPRPPSPAVGAGKGAARSEAVAPLPASLKSGWTLHGKAERFDKRTLFDRIDGAAPPYIRAGFEQSWGAEYRQPGRAEPVTVDAYDMGGAARAFGMYAAERDPKYAFIEVGDEGYLAAGSLNFWRGRYYVKLAGFEEGEAMDRALKALGHDLAAALPADPAAKQVATLLGRLPTAQRQPHGEGFSLAPLDGIAGLSHAYHASYQPPGTEARYRLFLVAPGEGRAAERLAQIEAHWKGAGNSPRAEERSVEIPGQAALGCRIAQLASEQQASFALACKDALGGALEVPRAALETTVTQVARMLSGTEGAR